MSASLISFIGKCVSKSAARPLFPLRGSRRDRTLTTGFLLRQIKVMNGR